MRDVGFPVFCPEELLAPGARVFTLSYHSPSLKPGCTPYVLNEADLERLLQTTAEYIDTFRASRIDAAAGLWRSGISIPRGSRIENFLARSGEQD
jgi:hypothetical protein